MQLQLDASNHICLNHFLYGSFLPDKLYDVGDAERFIFVTNSIFHLTFPLPFGYFCKAVLKQYPCSHADKMKHTVRRHSVLSRHSANDSWIFAAIEKVQFGKRSR